MSSEIKLLTLPATGFMRVNQILKFIPIARSTWWDGVKRGIYPKPIKLSDRVTVWRAEDIRELIQEVNHQSAEGCMAESCA